MFPTNSPWPKCWSTYSEILDSQRARGISFCGISRMRPFQPNTSALDSGLLEYLVDEDEPLPDFL